MQNSDSTHLAVADPETPPKADPNSLAAPTPDPQSSPSLPTDTPHVCTPHELAKIEEAQQSGQILRNLSAAAYLSGIGGKSFGDQIGFPGYQAYRDDFLRDAGNPSDPIERMLLEQLVLAHHAIGRLHDRASHAASADQAKVFYGAIGRLLAEMRRLALAIRDYRLPRQPKVFQAIKQQNIASEQQVALVDNNNIPRSKKRKSATTKLTSKPTRRLPHVPPAAGFSRKKPAPRYGRKMQPNEAQRPVRRGKGAITSPSAVESTVETLDRTKDRHGKGPSSPKR